MLRFSYLQWVLLPRGWLRSWWGRVKSQGRGRAGLRAVCGLEAGLGALAGSTAVALPKSGGMRRTRRVNRVAGPVFGPPRPPSNNRPSRDGLAPAPASYHPAAPGHAQPGAQHAPAPAWPPPPPRGRWMRHGGRFRPFGAFAWIKNAKRPTEPTWPPAQYAAPN